MVVLQLMPIAGGRTTGGMFTQGLAGAMGGFMFAQLTKPKQGETQQVEKKQEARENV